MTGYHSGYMRGMISTLEVAPGSPGAGDTNGVGVDMAGWDGVVFQALIGVLGNGGTYDLRVVGSDLANFSGAVNITDQDTGDVAKLTQVPNTVANFVSAIDVFRPPYRYVRVVSTVGTNNVNVSVMAHRYRAQGRTPYTLPNSAEYVSIRAS